VYVSILRGKDYVYPTGASPKMAFENMITDLVAKLGLQRNALHSHKRKKVYVKISRFIFGIKKYINSVDKYRENVVFISVIKSKIFNSICYTCGVRDKIK
jgi:hypothetical protein